MNQDIKLGVSLYSFSGDFVKERRSLEDCLRAVASMGFKGIEIVAAQMVPNYPYPSDEWLYTFRGLMEENSLSPVCWSAYIDNGLRSNRDLTREEIIQFTYNDMVYAKKAGFPIVRTQHSIGPEIFEAMVPACKELDIMLTIEMHHPHNPDVPVWKEYIELMHKYPKQLGAVPDFSIFQHTPHRLLVQRLQQAGFDPGRLQAVLKAHGQGVPCEEAVKANGLSPAEAEYTEQLYEKFNPTPIEGIDILVPVSPYMHGKFYILDGEEDPCIPYDKLLPRIKDLGFKGYIAAEYEGHHFDMSVDMDEQLNRYAGIFHKYID